jgi:CheY-like chemotaxis protein
MMIRKAYRIILTDCNMPNLNGFQMTEIIRQQEHGLNRHIPIIAITANALAGEGERCLQAGMDDYLAKPIELQQLHAKLKQYWTHCTENMPPLFSTAEQYDHNATPFDHSVLQDTLGKEPDKHRPVLHIFQQSAPASAEEIQQAICSQDLPALGNAAHKLKSAARAIGARPLATICQLLEIGCFQNDWELAAKQSSQLMRQLAQVEAAIADYMHGSGPNKST